MKIEKDPYMEQHWEYRWFAHKIIICFGLLVLFSLFAIFIPEGISLLIDKGEYEITLKEIPIIFLLVFIAERICIKLDFKSNKKKLFIALAIELLLSILLSIGFYGITQL